MSHELARERYDAPPAEALIQARDEIVKRFLGQPHVHTVEIGEVRKDGHATGEVGIVVRGEERMSAQSLDEKGLEPIPQEVEVLCGGEGPTPQRACKVRVDFQQAPQPKDQRLRLPNGKKELALALAAMVVQAGNVNEWRSCFPSPMPGGVQIAPEQANWVGTLSCAVRYLTESGWKVGALTNWHVATGQIGRKLGQPDGGGGHYFGKVVRGSDMRQGVRHRVDATVIDTWRDDKGYAPGRHTVAPEQFKLGKIVPSPVLDHKIGDLLQKSGRTTGQTAGRVVGVLGVSQVDYGEDGVLEFVDQTTVRGDSELFSGPGDSGSLVLTRDMRPYGLLFAGGGGTTIINPIRFVMEEMQIEFFDA